MAQLIINKKGFLIIEATRQELQKHFGFLLGKDGCNRCFNRPSIYYYVPVLDQWLCQECYLSWSERVVRTSGDEYIETRNINKYKKLLNAE